MSYFCKDTHKLSAVGRDVLDIAEDHVGRLYDKFRNNEISMWEHALKVKNHMNDCNTILNVIEKADLHDDRNLYTDKEVEVLVNYKPDTRELFTVVEGLT